MLAITESTRIFVRRGGRKRKNQMDDMMLDKNLPTVVNIEGKFGRKLWKGSSWKTGKKKALEIR